MWNSCLDTICTRVMVSSLDVRDTLMVRVSLGCRRLAQMPDTPSASRMEGMATRYALRRGECQEQSPRLWVG